MIKKIRLSSNDKVSLLCIWQNVYEGNHIHSDFSVALGRTIGCEDDATTASAAVLIKAEPLSDFHVEIEDRVLVQFMCTILYS